MAWWQGLGRGEIETIPMEPGEDFPGVVVDAGSNDVRLRSERLQRLLG